mmetsp:Transcript_11136/g.21883  ORF Transcript_11136/g.21883 Transcript_11136/m.21883 type:complete len:392 (-) Transcript_11136:2118-3293(-)
MFLGEGRLGMGEVPRRGLDEGNPVVHGLLLLIFRLEVIAHDVAQGFHELHGGRVLGKEGSAVEPRLEVEDGLLAALLLGEEVAQHAAARGGESWLEEDGRVGELVDIRPVPVKHAQVEVGLEQLHSGLAVERFFLLLLLLSAGRILAARRGFLALGLGAFLLGFGLGSLLPLLLPLLVPLQNLRIIVFDGLPRGLLDAEEHRQLVRAGVHQPFRSLLHVVVRVTQGPLDRDLLVAEGHQLHGLVRVSLHKRLGFLLEVAPLEPPDQADDLPLQGLCIRATLGVHHAPAKEHLEHRIRGDAVARAQRFKLLGIELHKDNGLRLQLLRHRGVERGHLLAGGGPRRVEVDDDELVLVISRVHDLLKLGLCGDHFHRRRAPGSGLGPREQVLGTV